MSFNLQKSFNILSKLFFNSFFWIEQLEDALLHMQLSYNLLSNNFEFNQPTCCLVIYEYDREKKNNKRIKSSTSTEN